MRKAKYDLRKVICPNSSCIGFSNNTAKPGYWITWKTDETHYGIGRVLGRIAKTDHDGSDCAGYLAVMALFMESTHAGVRWVDPREVTTCYEKPPADLLAWITGADWVKNAKDVARMVAMSEHGTTSDDYIATRNDPDKAYNARPEYVAQFILKA